MTAPGIGPPFMKKATRRGVLSVCVFILAGLTLAQPKAGGPSFEVATIKSVRDVFGSRFPLLGPAISPHQPGDIPMKDPERVMLKSMPLRSLIAMAYRLRQNQVRGPEWMESDLFDLEAKVPPGTPKAQVNEMLQSLLRERFGLEVHHETKELPGYALLVGKGGPKLTAAPRFDPAPNQDESQVRAALAQQALSLTRVDRPPVGATRYRFKGIDAGQIAGIISQLAQAPVLDMTRLKGTYDVELEITADAANRDISIVEAVEKLGLQLQGKRIPTDLIAVDKVLRTPTPN